MQSNSHCMQQALFPGRDYLQQLRLIIECLGPPSASDLTVINNPQAVEYIKALPKKAPTKLQSYKATGYKATKCCMR